MNNNGSNYYAPVGMNHGVGGRQQYSYRRRTLSQEHQIFQASQLPINDNVYPRSNIVNPGSQSHNDSSINSSQRINREFPQQPQIIPPNLKSHNIRNFQETENPQIPQNVANRQPPLYNNLKSQNNGMTAPRQPPLHNNLKSQNNGMTAPRQPPLHNNGMIQETAPRQPPLYNNYNNLESPNNGMTAPRQPPLHNNYNNLESPNNGMFRPPPSYNNNLKSQNNGMVQETATLQQPLYNKYNNLESRNNGIAPQRPYNNLESRNNGIPPQRPYNNLESRNNGIPSQQPLYNNYNKMAQEAAIPQRPIYNNYDNGMVQETATPQQLLHDNNPKAQETETPQPKNKIPGQVDHSIPPIERSLTELTSLEQVWSLPFIHDGKPTWKFWLCIAFIILLILSGTVIGLSIKNRLRAINGQINRLNDGNGRNSRNSCNVPPVCGKLATCIGPDGCFTCRTKCPI